MSRENDFSCNVDGKKITCNRNSGLLAVNKSSVWEKILELINNLNFGNEESTLIEREARSNLDKILLEFRRSKKRMGRMSHKLFAGALIFHLISQHKITSVSGADIASALDRNIFDIYKFKSRHFKSILVSKKSRLFYLEEIFNKYSFPVKCKEVALHLLNMCEKNFLKYNNVTVGVSIAYYASVICNDFNIPIGMIQKDLGGNIYQFLRSDGFNEILDRFFEMNEKKKKFNIIPKKYGEEPKYRYITEGYAYLRMPIGYHPSGISLDKHSRVNRGEHIIIMEKILAENPHWEVSRMCLIDGKYLSSKCVVHHINHDTLDNRIGNLWVYKDNQKHLLFSRGSLYKSLGKLVKLGQVYFDNGRYYLNENFDYRKLDKRKIDQLIKPTEFKDYNNISDVNAEVKRIDWNAISSNWTISFRKNQYAPPILTNLDPFKDCSKVNPLYRHKLWVETLVNDERFRLSDYRLGKLCGIDDHTAYKWRHLVHKIPSTRGRYRFLRSKYIMIKLPKSYTNPYAKNLKDFVQIQEHRYKIERHLAKNPSWKISQECLNGKYLIPRCKIHHINYDTLDNRIGNLWVCKNFAEHNLIHSSGIELVKPLLEKRLLIFVEGIYQLNF